MRTRTTVTLKARKQRRKTWTAWLVSLQIFVTDYSIWQLEIHSDKNNQKDMCQSRIQDGLVTPSACLLMYQNFESLREGCMIIQNTNLKLGLVNILKLYTFKSEFHALVPYNLYVVLFWHVLHQRKCYWPSHSPMHCNGLNFNIFCKKIIGIFFNKTNKIFSGTEESQWGSSSCGGEMSSSVMKLFPMSTCQDHFRIQDLWVLSVEMYSSVMKLLKNLITNHCHCFWHSVKKYSKDTSHGSTVCEK